MQHLTFVSVAVLLISSVTSDTFRGGPLSPYGGDESYGPVRYDFNYDVNDALSGNYFGHKESRDGSVARGVYYVRLPDGRLQKVSYTADQAGYRATVTYDGAGGAGGPYKG